MIENTAKNNGKKREGSQEMNRIVSSFLLIFIVGCGDIFLPYEPTEPEVNVWELPVTVELDTRLDIDNNGYYHLDVNDESWQTLHRLSGHVYRDGEPLEVFKVYWMSSHYWYMGDTLGYIVNTYLNSEGVYVSLDTSFVTGFDGMEVPTINEASYSNSDGEINTMFAPVRTMESDTVTVTMYYYNYDYELIQESFYIVLD